MEDTSEESGSGSELVSPESGSELAPPPYKKRLLVQSTSSYSGDEYKNYLSD